MKRYLTAAAIALGIYGCGECKIENSAIEACIRYQSEPKYAEVFCKKMMIREDFEIGTRCFLSIVTCTHAATDNCFEGCEMNEAPWIHQELYEKC